MLDSSTNKYLLVRWRVLRGVLEQVRECHRREPRIDLNRQIGIIRINAHGTPLQSVTDVSGGRVDDVSRIDPLPIDGDRGGVDASHIENVLKQTRQSVEFGDRRV